MSSAKPATGNGGHRITISGWKPYLKGTLIGFFTATLPSGLILHSLMLHQKGEARWIGFPARGYTDAHGQRQFARFVEFSSRTAAERFRDQVLTALDKHLTGARP